LNIAGAQNNEPGAALNVLAGRVNLKGDAGIAATAASAASANLLLRIGKGETISSLVVLGANQELAGLEVAAMAFTDAQGLDLNSPTVAGGFRAVSIYAADLAATKTFLYAAIANANVSGAADPHDGIFDSGLASHPGAKIGVAIVNDAHGDANVLIRPTIAGDLNLDGMVSISDFIDLAANFNAGGLSWQEGDLNYDGRVTISDFIDLAANFNLSYGPTAFGADNLKPLEHGVTVPEPEGLGVLIVLFFSRRRRAGRDARATRCRPSSADR
jgi:hypothetical protein